LGDMVRPLGCVSAEDGPRLEEVSVTVVLPWTYVRLFTDSKEAVLIRDTGRQDLDARPLDSPLTPVTQAPSGPSRSGPRV